MNSKGILNKMTFVNKGSEFNIIPSYELEMGSTKLDLSDIIGKSINLRFLNRITCISCGRDTKKSYGQGYCYPCFISVSYTHLRAHETVLDLVCRLLLEKKNHQPQHPSLRILSLTSQQHNHALF